MQSGQGQQQEPGSSGNIQTQANGIAARHVIAIPSYNEVRQAQRASAAPPILFMPINTGAQPR